MGFNISGIIIENNFTEDINKVSENLRKKSEYIVVGNSRIGNVWENL